MSASGASEAQLLLHLIDDLECGAVEMEEVQILFRGEPRFHAKLGTVRTFLKTGKVPGREATNAAPAATSEEQKKRAEKSAKRLRDMLRRGG